VKTRPRGRQGRLVRVIDRNTAALERIHRAVAGFPLDVLERVDRLERPVARVRKLQDRSIGATYDLVRGIEQEVARLVRPRRSAKRRAAKRRAAKRSTAKKTARKPSRTATTRTRERAARAS
jgi:hypothetical protein